MQIASTVLPPLGVLSTAEAGAQIVVHYDVNDIQPEIYNTENAVLHTMNYPNDI